MDLPRRGPDEGDPADISTDRLIAEIMDLARRISFEQGSEDCMPFGNWLRAEDEIRKKYRLPPRSGPEGRES